MKKISIIVPAYNEEKTVVELLEMVTAQTVDGFEFEVIVVDDGSTDGTQDLLRERPDLYTTFICLEQNRGKGGAVIEGLKAATGEYILFQDADLEYDPVYYAALLVPVRRFDADIVIGSRFMAPKYSRVHYFWHKVGNHVITLLFNVLFNTTYSDIYSCYLMYRRSLLDPGELKSVGWEQHAEILSTTTRRAKVVYEVPISYHGRSYDEGKKIKAFDVIPVIWMIIKQRFQG